MNWFMKRRTSLVRAFTLIEMLIAMAVTLLLMAALGKGFAYVGENIRDSRTQVALANDLRDITNRLQTELSTSTAGLKVASASYEPSGYFMYYEGPVTDATSSLFLPADDPINPTPASRYGDFDDYLAFTAVAMGDSWFTGKVPRFILDQKAQGDSYTPGPNALDPVVIKSKYAEIVYFVSPEYEEITMNVPDDPAPVPLRYVDVDQDGIPDRIKLHKRVLLIRPDLNITPTDTSIALAERFPRITPRAFNRNGAVVNYLLPDTWPNGSNATLTDAAASAPNTPRNAWLFGMAAVHQQCDLSLRRVLVNGVPRAFVAANSLEDLAKPHNRFAHVRVPGNFVGLDGMNDRFTSMPILALGNPLTIFNRRSDADAAFFSPPSGPGNPVVTPQRWSGFLRPEFVLGYDRVHRSHATEAWGANRRGEDVVATDLLAFDVKIYDTQAPMITTTRTPTNGTRQVVTPSEPGYREAFRHALTNVNAEVINGGFVDLMHPVLAGGSMRGWQARRFDPQAITPLDDFIPSTQLNRFRGQFGGVQLFGTPTTSYTANFYRSGKILVAGNQIGIFQPTWDTFTSHYETDGLEQSRAGVAGTAGSRWRILGTASPDRFSDGVSGDLSNSSDSAPPFSQNPQSIQVSIRLENVPNRAIKQLSVVYRDTN